MIAFAAVFRKRCEWLAAFLKRRWFLLSCVVVLLTCTVLKIQWQPGEYPRPRSFLLDEGSFKYVYVPQAARWDWTSPVWHIGMRSPTFGGLPHYSRAQFHVEDTRDSIWLFVPIWIPLSAVLGWIVFLELRWREKRVS